MKRHRCVRCGRVRREKYLDGRGVGFYLGRRYTPWICLDTGACDQAVFTREARARRRGG